MSKVPLNLCLSLSQDPLLQLLRPRPLSSNHSPEDTLLTPCPTLPMEPAAIKRARTSGDSKREKEKKASYKGCERKMHFPICSPKAELWSNTKTTFDCPPTFGLLDQGGHQATWCSAGHRHDHTHPLFLRGLSRLSLLHKLCPMQPLREPKPLAAATPRAGISLIPTQSKAISPSC